MSLNLSYSDVDSQLGTQKQNSQDMSISVSCSKRNCYFIQQIFLNSYYVPGTILVGEGDCDLHFMLSLH